jgi:hypothetical protein
MGVGNGKKKPMVSHCQACLLWRKIGNGCSNRKCSRNGIRFSIMATKGNSK